MHFCPFIFAGRFRGSKRTRPSEGTPRLQADRHKYVKIAYHGFEPLTKEARQTTYSRGRARLALDGPEFTTIDTLFSLAEAYLFMQVRWNSRHLTESQSFPLGQARAQDLRARARLTCSNDCACEVA